MRLLPTSSKRSEFSRFLLLQQQQQPKLSNLPAAWQSLMLQKEAVQQPTLQDLALVDGPELDHTAYAFNVVAMRPLCNVCLGMPVLPSHGYETAMHSSVNQQVFARLCMQGECGKQVCDSLHFVYCV